MPERFECTTLAKKALYKYSSFLFPFTTKLSRVADVYALASAVALVHFTTHGSEQLNNFSTA